VVTEVTVERRIRWSDGRCSPIPPRAPSIHSKQHALPPPEEGSLGARNQQGWGSVPVRRPWTACATSGHALNGESVGGAIGAPSWPRRSKSESESASGNRKSESESESEIGIGVRRGYPVSVAGPSVGVGARAPFGASVASLQRAHCAVGTPIRAADRLRYRRVTPALRALITGGADLIE
jgi:hypothetical protein